MAMTSPLIPISDAGAGAGPAGLPPPADNLRPNRHADREIDPHAKPPNVSARDVPVPSPALLPVLLQYLLPPSPAGMPPHHLSRALSSRHLYLNIQPSVDLRAYYALTSASAPAVEVLEEIGACRRAEDGLDSIIAHTGYTSEGGCGVDGAVETKAFVQLQSERREVWVVLIWEEGEWKYTDVRSAPLLEELSSTPTLAIASANGRHTKSKAKSTKVVIQTPSANDLGEGDDSGDDYWGRYGANSDSEDEESGVPRNGPTPFQKMSEGKGKANSSGTRSANEDAYWAQYGVGSVTASPGISPRVTMMPVQQQYDSTIDGEEAENRELRIAIEQALTRLPVNPQPGAPKARMLNLASISPVLRSSSSSSHRQAPPDTNTSSIFSSDSHQGPYNHSAPHPHPHTLSTRYGARDSITNETLNLHRGPLPPTGRTARGLALDLNTPPPTEHTISITSVLPTLGSPTSAMAPVFATAGSGPMAGMSPLLVGMGSPVVDAVERSMVSGVATHATGGSVAEPIQEPGEPVSLLDTLMREGRAAVATSSSNQTDGDSTKEPAGDPACFAGDEAVLQSVRGVFRMWRILRGTTRGGSITGDANAADLDWNAESMEAKREFLNLVVRALADS